MMTSESTVLFLTLQYFSNSFLSWSTDKSDRANPMIEIFVGKRESRKSHQRVG